MRIRVDRLAGLLEAEGIDCCVAVGARYGTWLTSYSRYFSGPSATVVGADGETTLVVPPDEVEMATDSSRASRVVAYGSRGFGLQLDSNERLMATLAGLDSVAAARRIGVAGMMAGDFPAATSAELRPLTEALDELSRIKDNDELDRIAHAYSLCWAAQAAVADAAAGGATEIEMFSLAQSAAQIAHGGPVEFVADVLVGDRSSLVCCPVAVAGSRPAGNEDWVVADIAVGADGYWGDTCRTHLQERTPDHVREAVQVLEGIRTESAAELRPGTRASDLYRSVADRIGGVYPGGTFPHHAGHGIGLTGFEYPHIVPADGTELAAGMVVALEPGVYFPGSWGARVEQLFVVGEHTGIELAEHRSSPERA